MTSPDPRSRPRSRASGDPGVVMRGVSDVWVKLARCCTPGAGRRRSSASSPAATGVSVHRSDCVNVEARCKSRRAASSTSSGPAASASLFLVNIQVEALDRARLLSRRHPRAVRPAREHPVGVGQHEPRPDRAVQLHLRDGRPQAPGRTCCGPCEASTACSTSTASERRCWQDAGRVRHPRPSLPRRSVPRVRRAASRGAGALARRPRPVRGGLRRGLQRGAARPRARADLARPRAGRRVPGVQHAAPHVDPGERAAHPHPAAPAGGGRLRSRARRTDAALDRRPRRPPGRRARSSASPPTAGPTCSPSSPSRCRSR